MISVIFNFTIWCSLKKTPTYEKLISNSQFGFRANRSTTYAIFILQNAIHLSSKPLFLCFIDLKAAYDWINRDMLFIVLQVRLESSILINILKALYTGTTAAMAQIYYFRLSPDLDMVVLKLLYSLTPTPILNGGSDPKR